MSDMVVRTEINKIELHGAGLADQRGAVAHAATPATPWLQRLQSLRLGQIRCLSTVWAVPAQPPWSRRPGWRGGQGEREPRRSGTDAAGSPPRPGVERDVAIETRGVLIAGENPMIVLYRPESDECVAIASMWTCSYSEAGAGRALVIWVDPEATGLGTLAPVGIFTDNPELARFVWTNFYNDYAPIQGRGIEDAPLHTARFTEQSGGRRLHRISCTSGTTTIELEWRDIIEVFRAVTYPTGYEVSVIAA
ncbi:MAG: hypothetical protein M3121_05540, partial [Chloroflexota bacterium]|nr:hypothetical protein [Chloroflexota bacterium]